ncbi:hypothetical protein UNPF46_21385 [Bradyrhizobium sp. UNPF46]|uniref:ABC transporter permease n=1 Tax=Bradyrhizobium sp. UNPF46 TaxID=1141168 RepID=UPI0011508741|nr:ABC transporter permease subunit [Bradyrhizobium sp. UNPF46]TQF36708.1 hypothetical protein UNPF46_21385 [Bradyrhizobium sp. UNPF46]
MRSQPARPTLITALYSAQLLVIVILFFGALGNVLLLSFGTGPSSIANGGFTLTHYREVLTSPRVAGAAINSLGLAAATTLITLPLALATARLLVALQSPMARLLIGSLVIVPLLSNPVLRMLGYSVLLSDGGPLGWLVCGSTACSGLLFTTPAVVIGVVSNVLPICTLILFIQLLRIPATRIMAARNLGAGTWSIWWRIEMPQCATALVATAQLCIIFVIGDLLAPSVLGGSTLYTFAAAVNDRMKIDDWATAATMSVLLIMLVCLAIPLVLRAMRRSRSSARS